MFYFIGVIIAFFLSLLLATKKDKTQTDYLLSLWLFVSGLHLFSYFLYTTGQFYVYPFILGLAAPMPLMQGPCLYLYINAMTNKKHLEAKQALHFLPIIIMYVLFISFFFFMLWFYLNKKLILANN